MGWDNTTLFVDDDAADRAFRAEVRDWVAANVPSELCNRSTRIDPPALKPWHRKLFERGWIAPHWPKEYGGMGATLTQQIILFEEIARVGAPTPYPHGLNFIGPLIIEVGTPAQKQKHLPPILTGETTWCQGYSEVGAGSDLASLQASAALDGDHFVVNGHKVWTTNGHFADWMFALLRTDPDATPRHAGISMLLIDLKSPGVSVRPIQTIKGDAEFAEEFFVDVRVPRQNLLGPLNEGWRVANRLLGSERFTTGHPRNAAVLLNKAREVAELTGTRRAPGFLHKLASLEIDLLAFSAYYRHAASLHGRGKAPASMAPVIKIVGGELGQRASELLVEAAGPFGAQAEDLSIGNHAVNPAAEMFEMRRVTVGSGAVEIQRNIIAKRMLGLPTA
ncbi:MAG TPA: acyl-CoA dehydrogenase family protein [Xanthobacteraceae bacterium]|nr:acyl-CoA dehydrogenase family protein [Xanthobacteraceae bacterium]